MNIRPEYATHSHGLPSLEQETKMETFLIKAHLAAALWAVGCFVVLQGAWDGGRLFSCCLCCVVSGEESHSFFGFHTGFAGTFTGFAGAFDRCRWAWDMA